MNLVQILYRFIYYISICGLIDKDELNSNGDENSEQQQKQHSCTENNEYEEENKNDITKHDKITISIINNDTPIGKL